MLSVTSWRAPTSRSRSVRSCPTRIQCVPPWPLMPARRGMSVRGALGVGELAKRFFQKRSWPSSSGAASQLLIPLGVVAVGDGQLRQAVRLAAHQRAVDLPTARSAACRRTSRPRPGDAARRRRHGRRRRCWNSARMEERRAVRCRSGGRPAPACVPAARPRAASAGSARRSTSGSSKSSPLGDQRRPARAVCASVPIEVRSDGWRRDDLAQRGVELGQVERAAEAGGPRARCRPSGPGASARRSGCAPASACSGALRAARRVRDRLAARRAAAAQRVDRGGQLLGGGRLEQRCAAAA